MVNLTRWLAGKKEHEKMKIIAAMPNERILVSLKENELANLLGEYSRHNVKSEFINQAIKSETEIDISDIYDKHSLIVAIQKTSEYDTARRKLENMLEALTPIENKITAMNVSKKS